MRKKLLIGQIMIVWMNRNCNNQILASDRTVFVTFANTFDLLNFIALSLPIRVDQAVMHTPREHFPISRAAASGYSTQLCGDVTSKASTAALNKLRLSVNMLGSSSALSSYTLMRSYDASRM